MKNTSRVVLGLLTALSVLFVGLAPAAQAQTVSERGKQLAHSVTLATFIKVKNRSPRLAIDKKFNWGSNGCSSPGWSAPLTGKWDPVFKKACDRHDFGYRNFGHGLAIDPTPASKSRIDSQLLTDMRTLCASYRGDKDSCRSAASKYYKAVHSLGSETSWGKFTGKKCPSAATGVSGSWLCLFDDTGYGDRWVVFKSTGENDFNDINFGDKTSSAINTTGYAWVLYDDHDYKDTKFCLKAGQKVSNLGSYGFGDKTSSVKRMSGNTCPSGSKHL